MTNSSNIKKLLGIEIQKLSPKLGEAIILKTGNQTVAICSEFLLYLKDILDDRIPVVILPYDIEIKVKDVDVLIDDLKNFKEDLLVSLEEDD